MMFGATPCVPACAECHNLSAAIEYVMLSLNAFSTGLKQAMCLIGMARWCPADKGKGCPIANGHLKRWLRPCQL